MNENNDVIQCVHCNGTGLCQQSKLVETRTEEMTKWQTYTDSEGDTREYAVPGQTRRWKKNYCEICGEGKEAENEPDRLICQVCGGSGFLGIPAHFKKTPSE